MSAPVQTRPIETREARIAGAIVWVLVGVAFVLRIPAVLSDWPNPDEGFYLQFAAFSGQDFVFHILHTPHPPGFFVLHRLVAVPFEAGSVLPLRAVSLVAGALAVFAMARLAREIGGEWAGVTAAAITCFAPGAIEMSQVARPYAFLLVVLGGALVALLRYLRTGERRSLVVHASLLALALLSHYSSVPFVIASGAVLMGDLVSSGRWAQWRERVAAELALAAIAGLLFVFHVRDYVIGTQMQRSAGENWLASHQVSSLSDVWLGLIGTQRYLVGPEFETLSVLALIAALGVAFATRRLAFATLSLVVVAIWCAFSASTELPWGSTRHALAVQSVLIPLVAWPVGFAASRGASGLTLAAALAGLVLSFPEAPRRAIGADRLETRASFEHAARREAILEHRPFFDEILGRDETILLDRQTYLMLSPIWLAEGERAVRRKGYFRHAHGYGRAFVFGATPWMLRAGPNELERPDHLGSALLRLERARPRAFEGPVWIVLGGWHSASPASLEGLAERLAARSPSLSGLVVTDVVATRGLMRARLSFGASDAARGEPQDL